MVRAARAHWQTFLLPLGLLASTGVQPLAAQATINPTVAPRAAELARNGQRGIGTEMLSTYLAGAPDDAAAWIQLGRFYLLDIREWHLSGHPADSPGLALRRFRRRRPRSGRSASRRPGVVLPAHARGGTRARPVEDSRFDALTQWTVPADVPPLPDFIFELARNLISSCPTTAVIATGSDLETVRSFPSSPATARPRASSSSFRRITPPTPGTATGSPRRSAPTPRGRCSARSPTVVPRPPVCLTPLADRTLLGLPDSGRCASSSSRAPA